MKTSGVVTATFSLAVLFATSCSNGHLSRSSAKALIEAELAKAKPKTSKQPYSNIKFLTIGSAVSGDCDDIADFDIVGSNGEYAALASIGYLVVKPIKKNVWSVELTDKGKNSIDGQLYAHKMKPDCDQWQVNLPLSQFDHIEVTGIVEDGVHAKADVTSTFNITQAGLDLRPIAEKHILDAEIKKYGDKLGREFTPNEVRSLLGDEIASTQPSDKTFTKSGSIPFTKYDDGWKLEKGTKE